MGSDLVKNNQGVDFTIFPDNGTHLYMLLFWLVVDAAISNDVCQTFLQVIILMRHESDHSSAWNRHNGVGATLLENWVEERAVGDKIIKERSNIIALSKQGHDVTL